MTRNDIDISQNVSIQSIQNILKLTLVNFMSFLLDFLQLFNREIHRSAQRTGPIFHAVSFEKRANNSRWV